MIIQPPQLRRILIQKRDHYNKSFFNIQAKTLFFPYTFFTRDCFGTLEVKFSLKNVVNKYQQIQNCFALPLPNYSSVYSVCLGIDCYSLSSIEPLIESFWTTVFQECHKESKYNYWFERSYIYKNEIYQGSDFINIWERNSHNPKFFDDVQLPLMENLTIKNYMRTEL